MVSVNFRICSGEYQYKVVNATDCFAVIRSLRKRGLEAKDIELMMNTFLLQAEALWRDRPMGA